MVTENESRKRLFSWAALIVVALCAIHVALGLSTISVLSPTFDEPIHIAAGYSFLKTGDYRMDAWAHAPLGQMWAALPLLMTRPLLPVQHPFWDGVERYPMRFADLFLYNNRMDADKILNSGRRMTLVLSLFLGLAIYFFAKELYGVKAALVGLFLWCFAPFFLANGTLVTTDTALTLFYFLTMYLCWRWWNRTQMEQRVPRSATLLFGLSLGCALVSKHSAALLAPVITVIVAYFVIIEKRTVARPVTQALIFILTVLSVIYLVYGFHSFTDYYLPGLKKVFGEVGGGRSSFLMGNYSTKGWKYYFPVVFFIKTPLPLTVTLIATIFIGRLWVRKNILFILWPAAAYFFASCFSSVQIGHRHILPIYPFLIVWASGIYPAIESKKWAKVIGAALLLWYAGGTLRVHPWHLSYFNELIGPIDNGYRYVSDSNVDWGQGLKALGAYLKGQRSPGIVLCYFGTSDPHYYGIRYIPFGFLDGLSTLSNGKSELRAGDEIDFEKEPRKLFAISATNLVATYYTDKKAFAWLGAASPDKIVAHSIMIYDLSEHPKLYQQFNEMFYRKR